jgi:hypothetical protein
MEPRFGTDFSSVRVHTDSTAVQMNKDLRAQAFAHGSDIYYGAGKSPAQDSLTAHELTHVVQQTGAKKLQQKPILTRKENKEAVQPLTPNQELRHSPLEAKPGEIEESHNTLQTKKLPHPMSAVTWYKEQQSSLLEEEEAKKPAEPKQSSGGNPEHSLEENAHIEENVKKWGEKAAAKAKPQIDFKEAKSKTELASEAVKEIKTAGKPDSTAAKTDSALSEHQVKSPSKVGTPESHHSVAGKADAGKSAAPVLPATHQEVTPDSKAATSPPPQTVAQKAQTEHKPKDQPATESATAAPASTAPTVAAPPALESGGGTVEEASDNGTSGVEEEEIAAAAEQVPPGSAELEPAERDAALASLAEGSGGGGEAAGGGGGGGGAAIADKPTPPAPDVSQSEPSAALAAVSNLPPAQLLGALGGVGAAVGTSVGKQRAELAANPPQMERPTGSPMTSEGSAADRSTPSGKNPKAVAKTPEGQAKPVPQPKPVALSSTPPVAKVPQPQVKGDAQGKLDSGDAQKLQASLRSLPTSDPGLQQVTACAPPHLELQGNADPQQAQQQRGELEKGIADAHSKGQQELAQPMGENEIYPKVPQETLRAEGIGGGGGAAGGAAAKAAGGTAAGGGEGGDEAVSIIAQQEHGQEIQAGVAKAQAEIAAKRQEHSSKVEEEKARSHQEIAKLQTENSAQQAAERTKAQAEVQQQRSAWQKEHDTLITKSRKDADEAVSKGNKDVQHEQTQAETKASEHIQKGEEEAAAARQQGEQEAEKERQKGDEESGGILGWLADKAKAFFDGIKQAIQKAFELARAAVKAAIEGAQKLATAVIETARQAIVGIIKAVGAALIAIGDVLLAAFPEIRDRFRNAIKGVVKAAETAVNALADTLKKGVQAALNLLGKGLDAALGLLEKGMMAAVDIAKTAVQGAIKLADAAIKAIGAFAVLVKDVAANPSQWLSNLGAGANDGIKNHFWGAFQTAVKEWFSQKVEEVLGLGMTVWNVLKQGGINTAEVGKMAWEGIKSAIPGVLIQLLIEKVVSMIVPAAGTVMVIIEGLQAAWGTVSRILQAFERFMAFLKAVKTGQAGPPFGAALAAAGVVVIDFVSNWLLKRLRGPASKVAGKIKEIAKKIGNKVKKVVKKLGKKFGKLKDKFFGKKGGKVEKNKGRRHESDHDRTQENLDHKQREKQERDRQNQERLAKAKRELPGKIQPLLKRGVGGILLKARLAAWRIQYRLSALTLQPTGDHFQIIAKVNPEDVIIGGVTFGREELLIYIREIARQVVTDIRSERAADDISATKSEFLGSRGAKNTTVRHDVGERVTLTGMARVTKDLELRPRNTTDRFRFGEMELIRQQQQHNPNRPSKAAKSNKLVSIAGESGSGRSYLEVARDLDRQGSVRSAEALRRFGQRVEEPVPGTDPRLTTELWGILHQETERSEVAWTQAAFLSAMVQNGYSFEEALKLSPMFPEDSPRRARLVDKYLARHAGLNHKELDQIKQWGPEWKDATTPEKRGQKVRGPGRQQKEQMEREIRQIQLMIDAKQLKFEDKENAKSKIREIVFNFFGLSSKGPIVL